MSAVVCVCVCVCVCVGMWLPGYIFGDSDIWIAQYVSFQYLLV